jgi:diguanylate cyclase (GGDEF)-like protein
MRQAIASISTQQDTLELTVSASFGIASTNGSGFQLRELLAHADAALYEAKRTGRNCVVLHEERLGVNPAAAAKSEPQLPAGSRFAG